MEIFTRNRIRFLQLFFGAGLLISLSGCGEKEVAVENKSGPIDVPCTKVVQQTLDRVDQLPGEIRAYQDVEVYPKVPGFIKWIGVDRGSVVKNGQPMVTLEAPELAAQKNESESKTETARSRVQEAQSKLTANEATLLEAKALLASDNDTYERTRDASKVPGVVAPNDLVVLEQKVQADREKIRACEGNVRSAKALVKAEMSAVQASVRANENYKDIEDYLKIVAPFDGFVTQRNLHVGSFVGPRGQGAYPPIVTVQQLNLLRIVTPVPEVDVSGVQPGAKVDFTVSTHPGEKFTGTVARLGNYLEQKTRTMPVELNYWNNDRRILPGMFCEVMWPTKRQHPTLFVPSTAIDATSTQETFVNKVNKEDEIEWVKVKRGETMGDMCEVFGDLKPGDTIMLKGDDSLQPKMKVHPVFEEHVKTASEN